MCTTVVMPATGSIPIQLRRSQQGPVNTRSMKIMPRGGISSLGSTTTAKAPAGMTRAYTVRSGSPVHRILKIKDFNIG
jgi:hypothetical protein